MTGFRERLRTFAERACLLLVQIVIVGAGLYAVGRASLEVLADFARTRENAAQGAAAALYLKEAIRTGALPPPSAFQQPIPPPPRPSPEAKKK